MRGKAAEALDGKTGKRGGSCRDSSSCPSSRAAGKCAATATVPPPRDVAAAAAASTASAKGSTDGTTFSLAEIAPSSEASGTGVKTTAESRSNSKTPISPNMTSTW